MATKYTSKASAAESGRVPEPRRLDDVTRSGGHGARDDALLQDTDSFSRALGDLIRVVQFRDRDRACCHGLSVTQCYGLEGIIENGGLTVNELAAYLYLDKS